MTTQNKAVEIAYFFTMAVNEYWSHSIVILRRGVYELNLDFSALYKQIYTNRK